MPRAIRHVLRHEAFLASLLVAWPFLRETQPEVEQGRVVATDIAHKDADLTIVDLAPMATPLAFDAHRMRPAFGKAARIKGDDAIGLAQSTGHLRHQHLDQRAMIPWCDADEFLYDLSLDI